MSAQKAIVSLDAFRVFAGWHDCNVANANIHAGDGAVKGVAIREFHRNNGFGFVNYFLSLLPPLAEQARSVVEVERRLTIIREVEFEIDANLQRAQALRQSKLSSFFSLKKCNS